MRQVLLLCCLTACESEPWAPEAVLESTLARIDVDGSGSVEKAEWDAVAYEAPPFEEVDVDSDGSLSPEELQSTLLAQDPLSFDNVVSKSAPDQALQEVYYADSWQVRVVRDALRFQAAEILARDPSYPVASSERLLQVARGMGEGGTELRDTCIDLYDATRSVELQVPRWLALCAGPE